MAIELTLPRLGWTMEEGTFGVWLKEDGAQIRSGDLLYTLEGDKATQEVEALEEGILRILPNGPKEGDVLPVGALLGYLLAQGEEVPAETSTISLAADDSAHHVVGAPYEYAETSHSSQQTISNAVPGSPNASPRARRVAAENGVDWRELTGSGRTGRIVERDVRAAAQNVERPVAEAPQPEVQTPRATPVAQRVAKDAGIDLAEVTPSGLGARIQRTDVEAEVARRAESLAPVTSTSASTSVPHSRARRITAQRMVTSHLSTSPVTLNTEVDAAALVALRAQLKAAYERRTLPAPTYNDLFIKLVSVALQQHPALNATWQEDAILQWNEQHVGIAVDTDAGLLVPVVRDVQGKSVARIAAETRDLIARSRAGKLAPAEMQGGTFTISNLGGFGIDAFTPVINLPEAAILGIGRIVEKPVVRAGVIVARPVITLSLTFDHRVVDGAPAARFMQEVGAYIEEPALWLVE